MNDKLTDFEIDILNALRRHNDKNIAEIFSMDEYKNNLQEDVTVSRFREIIELLEDGGHIKRICKMFKEEFGSYNITPKGLRYLIDLERKS